MDMYERTNKLSIFLTKVAEELDIPESRYLEAKKRYESVGEWLSKDDSFLADYSPEIYPQGSFQLGTVVKPITNKDEYDIDLVCFLADLEKDNTSQRELKSMVGKRLKENDIYRKLLDEEGRRCWTLNYADEFHMDILPAIPDLEFQGRGGLFQGAILITDKEKIDRGDMEWPRSNPKGYAKWFISRQETVFTDMKKRLAEVMKASVDDVPDYKVRTPLQRAVQVLKRHRDIYFSKKESYYKPISIIITTLAARLYQGQENIFSAIYDILQGISEDAVMHQGKYYIPNPVNPAENFADKWNEDQKLPVAFFDWIDNARNTFCKDILKKDVDMEIGDILKESLGMSIKMESDGGQQEMISPTYIKVNHSKGRRPWGAS